MNLPLTLALAYWERKRAIRLCFFLEGEWLGNEDNSNVNAATPKVFSFKLCSNPVMQNYKAWVKACMHSKRLQLCGYASIT
jgi:hypothetical protein